MRCPTGKIAHKSKTGACIAARKLKDNSLNVYRCDRCSRWHVGHSNQPIRKVGRMNQLFARIRRADDRRKEGLANEDKP